MFPEFFEFFNPTRVVFSPGIVSDFKAELDAIGVKRYFLISNRGVNSAGIVDRVKKGLKYAEVEIIGEYFDVSQDAELDGIKSCAAQAKAEGAQGLIAVGGGSVIDTAKAVNILLSEGGDLVEDYSGSQTLTKPLKPLVVLPTTAGTGSEVTMAAVVYDRKNKTKLAFSDMYLLPNLAVLDPELTLSLPPQLTAATAMDALTHAVEAFISLQWSPYTDALAIGAVELVFRHVIPAVEQGQDLEARSGLQIAANMAGIAFSHAMVGCVHSMAHAVGGICRVPHGAANAILLPHGMEYNLELVQEKLALLAPVMGEEINGQSLEQTAKKSIEAVRRLPLRLNMLCELPVSLREVRKTKEVLPEIAEAAMMDCTSFYNPRPVTAEDILIHLQNAY